MNRILYIPHAPDYRWIKNRSFIIARQLSNYCRVYYVHWDIPESNRAHSKIICQVKNLKFSINTEGSLKIVNVPLLFWPKNSNIKYPFNEWVINTIIKKLDISIVINAGMNLVRFPDIKNVTKVYDLVDDHLDADKNLNIDARRLKQLADDIRCADLLTAVTEQVRKKVKDRFNLDAGLLPNGIDLTEKEFFSLPEKRKPNKTVTYSFIGNVDERWVDLNLALEAFRLHTQDYPDDRFRIIGGGDQAYIKRLSDTYNCPQINFLGPIDQKDIYDYFPKINIGVIPFRINSFTRNSFPIKAIEYACFGAPVISTEIAALKDFSFVYFGNTVSQWQLLYKKLRSHNASIDRNEVQPYIWENIVRKFYTEQIERLLG